MILWTLKRLDCRKYARVKKNITFYCNRRWIIWPDLLFLCLIVFRKITGYTSFSCLLQIYIFHDKSQNTYHKIWFVADIVRNIAEDEKLFHCINIIWNECWRKLLLSLFCLSFCTSENLYIVMEWVDSCLAHYLDVLVYKVIHPHSQTIMKMFEKIIFKWETSLFPCYAVYMCVCLTLFSWIRSERFPMGNCDELDANCGDFE